MLRASAGFPSLTARAAALQRLPWQDRAWTERLFASVTFSHLLELSRIDQPLARAFYELELLKEGWAVRELKRQINSMLFERVGLSRDKDAVLALAREGRLVETPGTILRDPVVLEFLGLPEPPAFNEAELESALLDPEEFLRELGRDFCFVDRQVRITVGGDHHYLDLLFFHRGLKCLVALDLKRRGEAPLRDRQPAARGLRLALLDGFAVRGAAHPLAARGAPAARGPRAAGGELTGGGFMRPVTL